MFRRKTPRIHGSGCRLRRCLMTFRCDQLLYPAQHYNVEMKDSYSSCSRHPALSVIRAYHFRPCAQATPLFPRPAHSMPGSQPGSLAGRRVEVRLEDRNHWMFRCEPFLCRVRHSKIARRGPSLLWSYVHTIFRRASLRSKGHALIFGPHTLNTTVSVWSIT